MPRRLLFDVTRLAWRARRLSPTGIDRVLLAYAHWLDQQSQFEVVPVAQAGSRLVEVSPARYRALRRSADRVRSETVMTALRKSLDADDGQMVRRPIQSSGADDWAPLAADLAGRWLKAALTAPPRGDIYLNLAHTGLHQAGLLAGLAKGCSAVVMVHDLIPVLYPQYCAPRSAEKHRGRLTHILRHAALVITNSAATQADLVAFATAEGLRIPPIETLWLGIEEDFRPPSARLRDGRPYFMFVGTIEARKNLAFLLMVWDRLAHVMGQACPKLLLVGRRGWENEAVIDHLERSPAVRRLVHEICDLSDRDLAELMAGARGLLAPSLAEGFDLPPVEAMAVGASVIASDIAVHRELLPGARLIDPLDGPAWVAAIAEATHTPAGAPVFHPPSWHEHFTAIAASMGRL